MQCQPSPCSGPVLVPHHGGRGRPGRLLRRGRGQRGDRAGAARGHLPGAVHTVQYSTVQTHCNLSLFLTSGGRSEVLFLRQEGSGGDNQLEIYLWNVRAAQIVCIEIKYTPTPQIIILPPNLYSYLLPGVTPTNPSPSKLSGLETNRRLWASERRMSGTSSSRGGTEQRKMGANKLHDPIL